VSVHLDLERTTYLVYGLMEADEKLEADAHVSDCASCAEAVRRLEEEHGLIVEATGTAAPREELVRSIAAQVYQRATAIRRARARRLWLLGCAAAAFFAAGAAFLSRTRDIAETRQNAMALGRIAVQRGEFWVDQTYGYIPTPGDRIRTDDPAGATIQLEEGSRFNISRGSMVEFRGARGPTAVLRLLEGEVRCNVVADPRPFTVEAAGATVTVVGTEFAVHVLEDQPFFRPEKRIPRPAKVGMLVTSGAVLFRTGEGELRVPAGWIALAGTKGAPWMWGELKDLANDKALDKMLRRTPDAKPKGPPGTAETGWKERTDADVQVRVDAVPWARLADALVRYHKEVDAAVLEQRPLRVEPDLKVDLELGWSKINQLASELRVTGDFMQACRNKLASVRYVEAVAEAMSGAPLTGEQLKKLNVPETIENLLPTLDPAAPALARWKVRAEKTLAFVRQLKDALPEEQYRWVAHNVGPSFFVEGYRVWLVEAANVDEAADRVGRIWGEQFQLPTYAQAPLDLIATQHVLANIEARNKFRRPPGVALTGVEELELSARLFDLQAQAERRVSEIPALNGETRSRVAAGSKTLLRIRIDD
jgi:hypothetical protein